jgi:hypothetical protein
VIHIEALEGVMKKLLLILALFQFTVVIALPSPSLAQEWEIQKYPPHRHLLWRRSGRFRSIGELSRW